MQEYELYNLGRLSGIVRGAGDLLDMDFFLYKASLKSDTMVSSFRLHAPCMLSRLEVNSMAIEAKI
jgi:hypothetical protein